MRCSFPLSVTLIAFVAGQAAAKEFNVYSSRHDNTGQALYDEFTEVTGIKVNLIEAKVDALIERMKTKGESSPADGSRIAPSEISSYEDLVDPTWEAQTCIRSSSNVYTQSLVASMIVTDGLEAAESWANSIVSNRARDSQDGDTDQIEAAAAGKCDVAVANHYYLAPPDAIGRCCRPESRRSRRHHLPEPK